MRAAFLGGGSLRLLPILRAVFLKAPEMFRGGEIRLVDLAVERAEAVGRLLKACPEYGNVNCAIAWTNDLDSALEGVDVMYLTIGARREPTETLSLFTAIEHGYTSSDNISVNGAFLSLRIGFTILDIAHRMEKICPDALMLIFPNPVSVYSCMLNTYTKIRALGICGGFNNHRWDLTRICHRRDEYDHSWNVVAAGINHMSFILRGDYNGEDIYGSLFPRVLNDSWKPMEIPSALDWARHSYLEAQNGLYDIYRRYGVMIFSTEGDGMAHLRPENARDFAIRRFGNRASFNAEAAARIAAESIKKAFSDFIESSRSPASIDWENSPYHRMDVTDITIPMFKAIAGSGNMRIVASRPNMGAVKGFSEDAPLEYTMDILGKKITPVENQYVPEPFYGLAASLSEFQRLQAKAIAEHDPQVFANALDAYPVNRFSKKRCEFFRKMFKLYSDLDPVMLQAERYFSE